jgi:protein O-GlcNAc transferase
VDIALDTVPRTGGTTTADALWMGVPVLSLAGERFIERLSATMLAAIGRGELIASSEDEYLEKAIGLALDGTRRATLRKTLRADMAASPLCDATGLAASLESAYRAMWRRYLAFDCNGNSETNECTIP